MIMAMIINTTITPMADLAPNTALLRVMTWLSPAFPVGAFSYSHGIERAVHDGLIHDKASLQDWLVDLMNHGSVWNDAVLFAASWGDADTGGSCVEESELGEAMAGSKERHMETMLQGNAFLQAIGHWSGRDSGAALEMPYPVAVAMVAARQPGCM